MTDFNDLAGRMEKALGLSAPPTAVLFSEEEPAAESGYDGVVAAGCVFWELGAGQVVATSAKDHAQCAIGIHTHNLANAPATQSRELEDTLGAMMGLDYVREAEVEAIPVLDRRFEQVTYQPLNSCAVRPDVVLVFVKPAAGLIVAEAAQRVDGAAPVAMGRPACALIPQVMNSGVAAMSLGCCGARAYLDAMTDDVSLWGLPGERLADYVVQIESLSAANRTLASFHALRKSDIAAGARPTVKESLGRFHASGNRCPA